MIPMLRRRLMSNMAKAKNIATGTIDAGNSHLTTISISAQTGFRPDHVAGVYSVREGGISITVSCFEYIRWQRIMF